MTATRSGTFVDSLPPAPYQGWPGFQQTASSPYGTPLMRTASAIRNSPELRARILMHHANGSPEKESPGLSVSTGWSPALSVPRGQPSAGRGDRRRGHLETLLLSSQCLGQPGKAASTQGEGWGEGQPDRSERGYRECLGSTGDAPAPGGADLPSPPPATHRPGDQGPAAVPTSLVASEPTQRLFAAILL
ncbi:hypothetical protein MG293_013972 [Ovis ammon polii]|uniref:Uncharacterized protein n=1 Tax=Ovis ammon polii TaxID=230172 RepID=A0AAD4Y2V3_OVIAM|nr:hypothetical protein MG293_013972 [Ovis ammon polii]